MSVINVTERQKDRFFVLKKNSEIDEFYTIEDALLANDRELVIIDRFKEFFSPPSGFAWRTSDFIFVGDDKKYFKLTNASWMIHSIDTTYKSSSRIAFNITISDPSRKIRRISRESIKARSHDSIGDHDVHLVQIALQNLYEHSKYQSWEQLDILAENNKLKKEIEALKAQQKT